MNEAYRFQVDTRSGNQNASRHQSKNIASAARSLTKSEPESVFRHETERVHMTARCVMHDLINRALDIFLSENSRFHESKRTTRKPIPEFHEKTYNLPCGGGPGTLQWVVMAGRGGGQPSGKSPGLARQSPLKWPKCVVIVALNYY